jgi:hypothetical protein
MPVDTLLPILLFLTDDAIQGILGFSLSRG